MLGDAEVDYAAAELYIETTTDDGAIDAAGKAHGDRITREEDGSYVVESVEPSPADDQADTEAGDALQPSRQARLDVRESASARRCTGMKECRYREMHRRMTALI